MTPLVKSSLARLAAHHAALAPRRITDLFAADSARATRFSRRLGDLHVDFAKQKLTDETLDLLLSLADAASVTTARDAMFAGERLNVTENRAVLHVALRALADRPALVDGRDVMADVVIERERMLAFAEAMRNPATCPIRHIVHIGIGGSDLGPACAARALKPFGAPHLTCHFIANVDGADLSEALAGLEPAETLVIVVSKTFTTVETMMNARAARAWLSGHLGESAVARHFCAVSTNHAAVAAFGIPPERIFGFWDWVGGRYSLWSSVGLSLAILIGASHFRALLEGARMVDDHFRTSPPRDNIPLLLGVIGVYHRSICGYTSRAIIPYDQRLARFPALIQQVDMESNGKSVQADGTPVDGPTGPLIWGEPGTNSQHSFFQFLHQGSDIVPVEFLLAAKPTNADGDQHDVLVANCLAQAQALMQGRDRGEVEAILKAQGMDDAAIARLAAHRVFQGDRPSTMILYPRLDPAMFGMLLALYEHRVFVEGMIWGVNSFDQWGVELGKERASALLPALQGKAAPVAADGSTQALLARIAALRRS